MNHPTQPSELDNLLVSTKFAPPKIGSRYILRAQLLDDLRRDRHSKLILATGSAGFGKTTLLAQWRQELLKDGLKVAWLSLSHDEKLLPNFRTHIFSAFRRLGVPLQDETLFATEASSPVEGAVASLVNGVAALDEDLYLILDDYHHVEDPWAHRLVQKLLEHSPGNLHIVIASRALPPLSVAKLRVMGQVAEIECADLPFNLSETRSFLDQNASSAKLGVDEVAQIHGFTNGWPASLQLVSIMLKSRPESRSTLHRLAWQSSDLQNYLAEDVVGHLPPELSEFMESISVCRRFNVSLAAAVSGHADAATKIARIEDENLLISRAESEDRSPWYRFHPLFSEFLNERLARRGADAVNQLHRRAAGWFADRRLIIEAVRHASLGGDLESAVSIIERSVPETWKLGDLGPLLHLLNNLPQETIAAHPRLLYLGALTLALTGTPTRAASLVAQMRGTDTQAAFRVALASATIAFQRDDTTRTLALLEPLRITESGSAFEFYVFRTLLIIALAAEGRNAESRSVADAYSIPPEDAEQDIALLSNGSGNTARLIEGRIADMRDRAASIYALSVDTQGRQSAVASLAAVVLAEVYYELDRIDDARELLANWHHSLKRTSPQIMIWATICEARLDRLQKSPDAALDLLDRQAAQFKALDLDRGAAHMLAEQVRILVATRRRERAVELTVQLERLAAGVEVKRGFRAEIPILAGMARARLDLLDGRPDRALDAVATARPAAEQLNRLRMIVGVDIIAAVALDSAGRTVESSERLAQAVRLGAELGLVRTFVDEGPGMQRSLARLLETAGAEQSVLEYAAALLEHFEGGHKAGTPDATGPKAKTLLTPRETEILGLIAAGMSNKRIALTLGITLETVKWNLKNVFLKLEVSSRYDAMIWARRQGAIS